MPNEKKIRHALWILLAISFILRLIVASIVDLGNDEVYYWTYAKFPDLSHFDHPPMVGWVIQLFTLNLLLHIELFIRLGAVVIGTLSTYVIFLIGKQLRDSLTGLYAAFLFSASIYCLIISGTFIMPDTPQVLFWLISLYLLMKSLPHRETSINSKRLLLAAGFTIGLALLSKYHSAFILFGFVLYILLFNRRWLKVKETYLSILIAFLLFTPVLVWNFKNDFISFTFHENRIANDFTTVQPTYFFTEILGQVFYNNPFNILLILISFIFLFTGKRIMQKDHLWMILLVSLPLELVILSFSLFDKTLPHWTGPAYLGFILIAAASIRTLAEGKRKVKLLPWPIMVSIALPMVVIPIAIGQINHGWLPLNKLPGGDFSVQIYGWKQLGSKFQEYTNEEKQRINMEGNAPVITFRWFPAANLDYYLATPSDRKLFAFGSLGRIHKYYWIDKARGPLTKGSSAYFIAFEDDYSNPKELLGNLYDSIFAPDTIAIERESQVIRKAIIYKLKGLNRDVTFRNINDFKGNPMQDVQ